MFFLADNGFKLTWPKPLQTESQRVQRPPWFVPFSFQIRLNGFLDSFGQLIKRFGLSVTSRQLERKPRNSHPHLFQQQPRTSSRSAPTRMVNKLLLKPSSITSHLEQKNTQKRNGKCRSGRACAPDQNLRIPNADESLRVLVGNSSKRLEFKSRIDLFE